MTTRTATRKLNRSQNLLTADQARKLPALYSTDGKGDAAVAQVKFFLGAYTWYATEYDAETGTFFGLVDNCNMRDQIPEGELGYFTAEELCTTSATVNVFGGARGSFRQPVERDVWFAPTTLGAIRDQINPARKLTAADRAAIAEFEADEADDFDCGFVADVAAEAEPVAEVAAEPADCDCSFCKYAEAEPTTPPAAAKPASRFAANYAAINWGR